MILTIIILTEDNNNNNNSVFNVPNLSVLKLFLTRIVINIFMVWILFIYVVDTSLYLNTQILK